MSPSPTSTYAMSSIDKDTATLTPSRRSSLTTLDAPPPPYELVEQSPPSQASSQRGAPKRAEEREKAAQEKERTKAYLKKMAEREKGMQDKVGGAVDQIWGLGVVESERVGGKGKEKRS